MDKRSLLSLSLLILFGCAAPRPEPVVKIPVNVRTTEIVDTFSPGNIQVKTVGETMVERSNLILKKGFIAKADRRIKLRMASGLEKTIDISKGQTVTCNYILKDGSSVCSGISLADPGIIRPAYLYYYQFIIDESGNLIGLIDSISNDPVPMDNVAKFLFGKTDIPQPGSYKRELVYNGKSRETIKVSYREYRDDFTRPALNQDLSYDLSESREIAFRDMRIDVLDATNSSITFRVK